MPRLIDRLADSTDFLRASGADAEGLDYGFAVPVVQDRDSVRAVCVLLSSARSPLSQAIHVWTPNADRSAFEPSVAFSASSSLDELADQPECGIGEGLVGSVWKLRRPIVCDGFEISGDVFAERAEALGLSWFAGWPVIAHGEVQAIVVLMD